jgi:hypothetical protein
MINYSHDYMKMGKNLKKDLRKQHYQALEDLNFKDKMRKL